MKEQVAPVVMLVGTFHFANPAKDLVKNPVCDVMSKDSQDYLEELAQKLSAFSPTAVLLEYDQKEDQTVNARYAQYLRDEYQLSVDEIEQLGFRIARKVGLSRVHSFDDRSIPCESQRLFEQLNQNPETEKQFNEAISQLTKDEHEAHGTLTLQDLLKRYNSPEMDWRNKSLYIMTNVIGVDEGFAGADASASWWRRNFRMFARIQKFAHAGERILAIGGQGHIAVIRDLLKLDSNLTSAEIQEYL